MGKHGTSFSVISNEMQTLSGEIKKTNTMVSGLVEDLSILLPAIAQMIEQTSDHAENFSGSKESQTFVIVLQSCNEALRPYLRDLC